MTGGEVRVRRLTCIVCPLGCELEVLVARGPGGEARVLEVRGASCPRGREWAVREVVDPRRVVITVLPVRGGDPPTVSVKTDRPIPKGRIAEFMEALAEVEAEAPVRVGQVLVRGVLGLADVVATREARPAAGHPRIPRGGSRRPFSSDQNPDPKYRDSPI